uniref:Ixodegrin B n=1 Tax=Rhipicephalus appendiculatus TaxID=34631 RepID=A0A131YTU6_RHIAP
MCHLSSVAIFLTVAILFATSTVTKCSGTKGSDDDGIVWGPTGGNGCDSSQQCDEGMCCVNKNGHYDCELKAQIGQHCSQTGHFNTVYNKTCPCDSRFHCEVKSEYLSICAAR